MAMLGLVGGCSAGSQESVGIGTSDDVVSIGLAVSQYEYYENIYQFVSEDVEKLDSPVEIQLVEQQDSYDYTQGLSVAQGFCEDSTMVGVVGHMYTDLCLSLKNVYDENKMPLLVPDIESNELLNDNNGYIYQTISNISNVANLYTTMAYNNDMSNIAIVYTNSKYGNELSKEFEQYLVQETNVTIVDKVCDPDINKDMPSCLKKWKALDVDTIFLFTNFEPVKLYLPEIEKLGSDVNVYISSDFESEFLSYDVAYGDNVYLLSASQYDYNPELEDLYQRYEDTYGERLSTSMAQIYDDVMIIAKAIAYNGVRTPAELKEFLDTTDDIGSIYGDDLYFTNNYIQNKMSFIQSYDDVGNLTYSMGFTNTDLDEIWYDYYAQEYIDTYARVGEYNNG